ncbi:MAG: zinc metallopeptidase [Desulfosporosinus sp.]
MFFHPMDFVIMIAFGLSLWAQFKVKGNFKKWSEVPALSGMTGGQAARILLDHQGLRNVPVELGKGHLSDHYNPLNSSVVLSEDVYYGNSIASLSVACHEVGHAIQHMVHFPMLVLRHRMFPAVNIASGIAPLLLMGGFLLQAANLIGLGIILFSAAVAFQLITLPVEFNASSRAKALMVSEGFIRSDEVAGVNKVLDAAALTYVAAALISVLELVKYVMIFMAQNEE